MPSLTNEAGARLARQALARARDGAPVQLVVCDSDTPLGDALALHHALARQGVEVTRLAQVALPAHVDLDGPNQPVFLRRSERVYRVLAALDRRQRLDTIHFSADEALGFRSIQAKRAGVAFANTRLMVAESAPSLARYVRERRLPLAEDLAEDHCRRYALTHADHDKHETASGSESPSPEPLVTVCIPYFNMGDYLDDALASLAAQTYAALEVVVIDDGSTAPAARTALAQARARYPHFRFLNQDNAGIGATRNRGLELARGKYYLPMDADNVAHADLVRRLVTGLERNPALAALSCYFLAFSEAADIVAERFLYAGRPIGGPRLLGCLQNVYGDGNALFRTASLRAVGGFGTERDASWEDWELFVKLVNAGYAVDVAPEYLFYYRHRPTGFSRTTSGYANQQRVLRRYAEIETLPQEERTLWSLLAGMQGRLAFLEDENRGLRARLASLRHRLADKLHSALARLPALKRGLKRLFAPR